MMLHTTVAVTQPDQPDLSVERLRQTLRDERRALILARQRLTRIVRFPDLVEEALARYDRRIGEINDAVGEVVR